MLDEMHKAREAFLQEQAALRKTLPELSKEQRDALRAELKEKKHDFLASQKEGREEIKKRMEELRGKLKEHQSVLKDAAKAEKQKSRKGGD